MAKVDLIALRSFKYGTRRLQAGDMFTAKENEARVFTGIRKPLAEYPRQPGRIAAPPARVIEQAAAATPPAPPAPAPEPQPVPAMSTEDAPPAPPARKAPAKRRRARKSPAKKG
jgi:hypothetical protein